MGNEHDAWPVSALRRVPCRREGYGTVEATLEDGRTLRLAVPASLLPALAHIAIAGLPEPSGTRNQRHKVVFEIRSGLVGLSQDRDLVLSFELAQGEHLSLQLTRSQALAFGQGVAAALRDTRGASVTPRAAASTPLRARRGKGSSRRA